MPHIEIKVYPGRSEEMKQELADKIAETVVETIGCKMTSVSVVIKDVEQENWKAEVWDKSIVADADSLYKKPGYTCE